MKLVSMLDETGETFYVNGSVYKTCNLTLCKTIQLLQKISGIKLQEFSECLNISPQQFSYKIRHKLNVLEIKKISELLNLNNNQIVNLFLK